MIPGRASTCHASNKVLACFLKRAERLTQHLDTNLVGLGKPARNRAVYVEHTDQVAVRHQRHDEFRTRIGVTDYMPGEGLHIGNPLGFGYACDANRNKNINIEDYSVLSDNWSP